MDYDNVDAKLSFHAKILNGQDTRPFHSSKQPRVGQFQNGENFKNT